MNSNETRKTKQNKNKTAILEKLMESIMSEEVDSEGIEDLSWNVDRQRQMTQTKLKTYICLM